MNEQPYNYEVYPWRDSWEVELVLEYRDYNEITTYARLPECPSIDDVIAIHERDNPGEKLGWVAFRSYDGSMFACYRKWGGK